MSDHDDMGQEGPFAYPEPPGQLTLPMSGERLRWCLDVIGWSRGELARRLNISNSTAGKMVQGKRFIPNRVALWLETKASLEMALPRPYFWQESTPEFIRDRHHAQQAEEGWTAEEQQAVD